MGAGGVIPPPAIYFDKVSCWCHQELETPWPNVLCYGIWNPLVPMSLAFFLLECGMHECACVGVDMCT